MRECFEERHGVLFRPRRVLQSVERHPAVRREVLKHGNHELQAAVPVGKKDNQGQEIENAHDHAGDG